MSSMRHVSGTKAGLLFWASAMSSSWNQGERAILSPVLSRSVQQFRERGFEASFSLHAIFDVQCTKKYKV